MIKSGLKYRDIFMDIKILLLTVMVVSSNSLNIHEVYQWNGNTTYMLLTTKGNILGESLGLDEAETHEYGHEYVVWSRCWARCCLEQDGSFQELSDGWQ